MTVFQLITELGRLASSGHGKDKVLVVLNTDNGYVYQEVISTTEYSGENTVGIIGDRRTTDDRREDTEWITD